ncbi:MULTISPECIES: LysE family translocator [unclassified Gilliamella]|uniref:LysE family translocator n=1 Tax=unclassified Gilliamella TaxID=2685620 RepID=UPI00226AB2D5|nr:MULTISPECIES: LysE family transporter [unclassified Gilliamella]MCX8601148.1 LysE family transporter [Gilliamella sp. B3722]MCX8607302.1 LysE family transporter [Gilliamella sp. B3771]MCX8610509.1 LysE family transporter [Gilliamella sp. B3891]MCX8612822.1 LysE family transporter [Gilliamella sp. B3773]MCX8614731.1 LysE family transporter [Gilliamella sp. B3770]
MTLDTIVLVTTVSFLGMVSPGPDFFLVLKNSLSYNRKTALLTCFGVITAILIHMSYCVAGIAMLITATPLIYDLLRYAGAIYLFWLGIKALLARNGGTTYISQGVVRDQISAKSAFMQGLFCNLLNPKATLFFLAIFTQLLNAQSSFLDKCLVALIIWLLAVLWWPFVVFIFQTQTVQRRYFKIQFLIDKLLGVILIILGVKVALGF